jgi:predicted TIM-barrel fold metal-dependent hydrolase
MKQSCACGRRHVLLGGLATMFASTAGASAAAKPRAIDVHHHVVPPAWVEAVKRAKLDNPPMTNWTPEKTLADMDKAGTATSILSPMPPQVGFLPAAEAAKVARESNEWTRQLAKDHPGRFGVFAMLPMPYIDESLKEIEYAFDTLKADGVGIMTNYGDKWLGYPEFAPVFDELNRRKAVVYTHPMSPNCCVNLVKGVPDAAIEWGTDTTRSIVNLIFSGAAARYGDVTFIFSHGGGALTAVAERLHIQLVTSPPYQGKVTRAMVDQQLKRFYYDSAQVANDVTIQALAKLVPVSQIMFGSDFPYRDSAENLAGLTARFNARDLAAIARGNATRILPAWRNA